MGFLRELWGQLASFSLPSPQIRFRMDGAFFQPDVLKWLAWREVGYALGPLLSLAGSAAVHAQLSQLAAGHL